MISHIQLVEYIQSLNLDQDSEAYDTMNRLLLLSEVVYSKAVETLVYGTTEIADFNIRPLTDQVVLDKINEIETGLSGFVEMARDVASFLNEGENLNNALRKYISGTAELTATSKEDFNNYIIISQQRGLSYVTSVSIDPYQLDDAKFESYGDLAIKYDEIIASTPSILTNKALYEGHSLYGTYTVQSDLLEQCFVESSWLVETGDIKARVRNSDFLMNTIKGVSQYGSSNIWKKVLNSFIKESAIKALDESLPEREACQLVLKGYYDNLNWNDIGLESDIFYYRFWEYQILLYCIPSLSCFDKDSAEITRLEETFNTISNIRDYLAISKNYLISLINSLKTNLVP